MRAYMSDREKAWLERVFGQLSKKVSAQSERIGGAIPYIAIDGVYTQDMDKADIAWWTNGFWAGLLWQMYSATGDERYLSQARGIGRLLDRALEEFDGLNHDVGFMWMHTAAADYRLTGSAQAKSRALHAATILAGRFNVQGDYIRAWNADLPGWVIIDCLMNLSLLYWASGETGDPRFAAIARHQADTALEKIMRPDGSVNHIVVFDPQTGEVLETPAGQGFASGSSWSRGQSWALYGFVISYRHTGDQRYLDAAKRAAHYFLACAAATDYLPLCDFRAPDSPLRYDATAGACAACGLLELAGQVGGEEEGLYFRGALRLLMAMEERFCCWNTDRDGILGYGRAAYHSDEDESRESIIYGDYFLSEAILRLAGKGSFIW